MMDIYIIWMLMMAAFLIVILSEMLHHHHLLLSMKRYLLDLEMVYSIALVPKVQ